MRRGWHLQEHRRRDPESSGEPSDLSDVQVMLAGENFCEHVPDVGFLPVIVNGCDQPTETAQQLRLPCAEARCYN